jgi:hypothetical protein
LHLGIDRQTRTCRAAGTPAEANGIPPRTFTYVYYGDEGLFKRAARSSTSRAAMWIANSLFIVGISS